MKSIKECEINKDRARDEVIDFGTKNNIIEDVIRRWNIKVGMMIKVEKNRPNRKGGRRRK